MRTSGPDALKAIGRSTAVLLCVLTVASCDSGESEAKVDHPCEIAPASEEHRLLREILRADGFQTDIMSSTNRAVEQLERKLREMDPKERTLPMYTCAYRPGGQGGVERATFGFGWVARTSEDVKSSLSNSAPYEVNGAFGETNDFITKLFVECSMPGGFGEKSKLAWFYADASYTVNIGRLDLDQTARDRQAVLTYLMTRRVTEALGCENKPLEKSPVVKPLPTP
ncbi:hypothetical protein [Streptomyces sp. NPDC004050]